MTPSRAARIASALVFVVASLATGNEPAPGGAPLLEACEHATLVAVGRIVRPVRLDVHGRAAGLAVERVLSGAGAAGETIRIAWEELAQMRPDRFTDGDRVLAALGPLPSESLWQQRFPVAQGGGAVRAVLTAGDAFLRRPDEVSIDGVEAWARLPAEERSGPAGATALAHIVAGAHPALADAALARLGRSADVAVDLSPEGAAVLSNVLSDATRPEPLRAAVVTFAGDAHVLAMRDAIAALAAPGSPLEADAIDALAKLDAALPADRLAAWLERPDARVRAVAVRHLSGPQGDARLAVILRNDAAPAVRAAATTTLLAHAAAGAENDAAPALFDADPAVRTAAAQGFAQLGERAVPLLQRLALERGAEDAKGPIAALALAGQKGATALREIVALHPDPKVRTLADFALGHVPSHDRGLPPDPVPQPAASGSVGDINPSR